ncbi:MAG TPA: L,D-transpeptidase family protein [Sphingomicrobium sp.]|nr:L,D-transpeptidase family protein [Sphingomicrobium sp.]
MKLLVKFAAFSALPLGWASAQSGAPPVATGQPQPVVQVQPAPVFQPPAPVLQPPPPIVVPPPMWEPRDALALLGFIEQVGSEGLDPADYDPAGLIVALRSGNPHVLTQAATDRFNRISTDLALGHVRGDARLDWHIPDKDLDADQQDLLLRSALAQHRVPDALRELLPSHPQYAALRHALAVTPPAEADKINRIRLNMDRWRWLPRDLGDRYIIVNVPAYTAALVEGGVTKSRHDAVAGAIKTPTPQMQATAMGVILNPWWEVPLSLSREVAGKRGYIAVRGKDGKVQRWRQPPGPSNALGKIKFVMPNPKAIFLHDTNARGLFDRKMRAFSHGCIRTQNVLDLAAILLAEDGGEWDRAKVDEVVASGKTVQANFVKPLPVYIVYMSSAALVDGRIKDYADIYKRDGTVLAALLDKHKAAVRAAAAKPDATQPTATKGVASR